MDIVVFVQDMCRHDRNNNCVRSNLVKGQNMKLLTEKSYVKQEKSVN